MGPNSDIAYMYVFSGAALLILLIAGINFVNLTTAQSFKRMKEIGVRKVIGARKGQLVKQHLGESMLFTVFSAGLALLLLDFSIPFYNQMAGKNLTLGSLMTAGNVSLIVLLVVFLTLLAGLYPAFFISGFQPANSIKSTRDPRSSCGESRAVRLDRILGRSPYQGNWDPEGAWCIRIQISIWTFLFSAVFAVFIAMVTISYQAVKASLSNPIDCLRYE